VVLVDYLESEAAFTGNYHAKLIGKLCQAIKNNRRDETWTARTTFCLIKLQRVTRLSCSFKRSNWCTYVLFVRVVTVSYYRHCQIEHILKSLLHVSTTF